ERLPQDEQPADAVASLDGGDLLADQRVGAVGAGAHVLVEATGGHQPVDAAPLVLHRPHALAERAVRLPDEVLGRDPDVVEVDLAEVAAAGHVDDGLDGDPRRAHVDDELGEPLVGPGVRVGPGDEVAPVGRRGAGGPDLLAVDDPVVAVAHGPGADAGDVGAGVRLAHADAPHRGPGDD